MHFNLIYKFQFKELILLIILESRFNSVELIFPINCSMEFEEGIQVEICLLLRIYEMAI